MEKNTKKIYNAADLSRAICKCDWLVITAGVTKASHERKILEKQEKVIAQRRAHSSGPLSETGWSDRPTTTVFLLALISYCRLQIFLLCCIVFCRPFVPLARSIESLICDDDRDKEFELIIVRDESEISGQLSLSRIGERSRIFASSSHSRLHFYLIYSTSSDFFLTNAFRNSALLRLTSNEV